MPTILIKDAFATTMCLLSKVQYLVLYPDPTLCKEQGGVISATYVRENPYCVILPVKLKWWPSKKKIMKGCSNLHKFSIWPILVPVLFLGLPSLLLSNTYCLYNSCTYSFLRFILSNLAWRLCTYSANGECSDSWSSATSKSYEQL